MVTPTITLAGEAIPAASLPDLSIVIDQGESYYTVSISIDAAFSNAQIAACLPGSSTTIAVGGMTWTGTVSDLECRSGYSKVTLGGATVAH